MSFDYSKLKGKIIEKYDTQTAFAQAIGVSKNVFSGKMKNKTRFSTDDIVKMAALLDIPVCEIGEYFFTQEV